MEQIGIALFGLTAIWLSQDERESWRKWACLFGLSGQPFWFYSSFVAEQWGILLLWVFYTMAWWKGVKTHWLNKESI